MAARTELEITWDGPIRGLDAHRVSLTAFGPALDLLMKAARRIASQRLTDALEHADTGRLASSAKNLDIEITGVREGSAGFSTLITFEPPNSSQATLFNELPERVGVELLEAIESEARGDHRSAAVRNYLRALPRELTKQVYNLHENGREIRRVDIGALALPDQEEALPAFIEAEGRISGVGFDPGRWEVKVKGEEGAQVIASATQAQVDTALEMRSQNMRVLALTSAAGTKLLVLETEEMGRKRASLEDIFDKWDEAFRALA
jgi:hypothetical protein